MCKIENGDMSPSYKLFEALMQRLGAPLSIFDVAIPNSEFERVQIEREIASRLATNNHNIQELLTRYEQIPFAMNKLEKQFYLSCKAGVDSIICDDNHKSQQAFYDALSLTLSDFTLETDLQDLYLTFEEIKCIQAIYTFSSINLCNQREFNKYISLLNKLKLYLTTHTIESEMYARSFIDLAIKLSNLYGVTGQFQKALETAEQGLECCIKKHKTSGFYDLLYVKGFTLVLMGNSSAGRRLLRHAIEMTVVLDMKNDFDIYKKDIISSFGYEFWINLGIII